ncbi:hypothetical protein [Palaeococcus ferrophilus]|uniref:hypothetical protein n=1 Tax=Palaeococcus ferrophilus TaxID=83868 RepID=UPI00064EF045|nr:hypothetical protein [Palaeococcus ferrophilus]
MSEMYYGLMSLGGILALVGIFLTWGLSRSVETKELGTKRLSNLLLLGGLLTALGFITTMVNISEGVITFAILLGPAVIVYSLSESGLVRANLLTLIQVALVVVAALVSPGRNFRIAGIASSISLVLLINVITGYPRAPTHFRRLAWLSSWGLVAFLMMMASPRTGTIGPVVYVFSMALWIYTLLHLLHLMNAEVEASKGSIIE